MIYVIRYFPSSNYDIEYDTPTTIEVDAEDFTDAEFKFRAMGPTKGQYIWAIDEKEIN